MHTCSPGAGRMRQEDCKFRPGQFGPLARYCLKKQNKTEKQNKCELQASALDGENEKGFDIWLQQA